MTKLYRILKTQLVLAVVLFIANVGFAQTVTVPANCRVVVAGNGGSLGFGQKVGDGGMVAMPDAITTTDPIQPNQGGIFSFNPPTATPAITTATWKLFGDLTASVVGGNLSGVGGNYNTVVQPGVGLQAKIFSYNKLYRPSSTETANANFGRSKGQVRVAYTQAPCDKSIVFDIFKTFDKAPEIIGPSCLKPLTTYTYSIDRVVSDNPNDTISFDSYYWSGIPTLLLNSGTFYTSADNSSITFTTGTSVEGFILKCFLGRVNPNTGDGGISTVTNSVSGTHATCTSKTIITAPAPAITVPRCVATGTVAAPAIFSITYPNVATGTTYSWSAANTGWVGPTTSTFTPVVNSPVNGQTTLTINTLGNNNPGELTLTIIGPCDPTIIKYQINRSITAPIAIVVPPTNTNTFCIGRTSTNNKYTLSPTNSNNIQWYTDPVSVTGVTLQNATTSTVTVNTTNAAVGSFILKARSAVAACNTNFVETTINVQPVTPQLLAGTPNCVVRSATTQVSSIGVVNVVVAVYNWLPLPAGVTCSNPAIANPTFTLNGTGVSSTLTCTVVGANGCNSFVQKTVTYIAITSLFPGGGFADQYLINGTCGVVNSWVITTAAGASTYTTSTPTIQISNSGSGTNNQLAISGVSGLPITSVCANLAGGIQVCTAAVGQLTQRLANTSTIETTKEILEGISIFPNPSNGVFFVKVETVKETAKAVLNDFNGKEIASYELKKGTNKLGNEELPKGTYFIVLTSNGKQETRQIVIK